MPAGALAALNDENADIRVEIEIVTLLLQTQRFKQLTTRFQSRSIQLITQIAIISFCNLSMED